MRVEIGVSMFDLLKKKKKKAEIILYVYSRSRSNARFSEKEIVESNLTPKEIKMTSFLLDAFFLNKVFFRRHQTTAKKELKSFFFFF